VERLKHGVAPRMRLSEPPGTTVALLDQDGELLALAEAAGESGVKLLKVFA
jgi:hypothetical protein